MYERSALNTEGEVGKVTLGALGVPGVKFQRANAAVKRDKTPATRHRPGVPAEAPSKEDSRWCSMLYSYVSGEFCFPAID